MKEFYLPSRPFLFLIQQLSQSQNCSTIFIANGCGVGSLSYSWGFSFDGFSYMNFGSGSSVTANLPAVENTKVEYFVPNDKQSISLKVYDSQGRVLINVLNEVQNLGTYEALITTK
jgi:hypothetical protein